MISWGVAKVSRKLSLGSTARRTCPPLPALWRKPDPNGSKLCHFSSTLTAAVFSAGGRQAGDGRGQKWVVWLICFIWIRIYCFVYCCWQRFTTAPERTKERWGYIWRIILAAKSAMSNKGDHVFILQASVFSLFSTVLSSLYVQTAKSKVRLPVKATDSGFRRQLYCAVMVPFAALAACDSSLAFMCVWFTRGTG